MNENLTQSNINREYKDRLFNFIFGSEEHKDWTLSLYNAINDSDYEDSSAIEFTTLKDVLYMGMRNDTSFIVSDIMSVFEHQSSFNPNMPVRLLQYVGNLYAGYIERNRYNKYGSTIPLPVPKLVVFYNGGREVEDETILRLSDSFPEESRNKSDVEVRVRMINVNYDRSKDLMKKCRPLKEYAWFISDIRENQKGGCELSIAVDRAIKSMPNEFAIKEFAIKEYLLIHKQGMLDTEYNEAKVMEGFREEGRREGLEQGIEQGIERGIEQGIEQGKGLGELVGKIVARFEDGVPIDTIAEKSNTSVDYVRSVLSEKGLSLNH